MNRQDPDDPPCVPLGPAAFFPEPGDDAADITDALHACDSCPVSANCLARALDLDIRYGIYAGIFFDVADKEMRLAREARAQDDVTGFVDALTEAKEATRRFATGETIEQEWTPERPCKRCGMTIEAGHHPPDTNGPRATCGLVSTYNKGCRCWQCKKAKARYHARSR